MGFFDDLFGPSKKDLEKAYREGREHYEEEGDTFLDALGDVIKTVVPSSEEEKARDAGRGDARRDSSPCFISTACVEARGLPDNCLELQVLRNFRDTFVRGLPEGAVVIGEYYREAPLIIRGINVKRGNKGVYVGLFDRVVKRSVELISQGRHREAFENYKAIVRELGFRYL